MFAERLPSVHLPPKVAEGGEADFREVPGAPSPDRLTLLPGRWLERRNGGGNGNSLPKRARKGHKRDGSVVAV